MYMYNGFILDNKLISTIINMFTSYLCLLVNNTFITLFLQRESDRETERDKERFWKQINGQGVFVWGHIPSPLITFRPSLHGPKYKTK